jgi:hypothetical protein
MNTRKNTRRMVMNRRASIKANSLLLLNTMQSAIMLNRCGFRPEFSLRFSGRRRGKGICGASPFVHG